MASSLLELIFRTRKQGTGAKEAADELKGVKTVLGDLGLGMLTAAGVTMTLRAAFNETVNVAQDYDQQVVKIATSLRISTEEASLAIQVADDFAVSQESLTAAMRIAQQQGVTPNIEGLAKLSDQYIAITDTQERAKFAQQNLGKNWMEFSRILEAGGPAIRAQADSIEKGLIVTEKAAKASENYRKALDNLDDTVMALKVSVGNGIIPIIVEYDQKMSRSAEVTDVMRRAQERGIITYFDAQMAMTAYGLGNEDLVDKIRKAVEALDDNSDSHRELQKNINLTKIATESLTSAEYVARAAEAEFAGQHDLAQHYLALAGLADGAKNSAKGFTEYILANPYLLQTYDIVTIHRSYNYDTMIAAGFIPEGQGLTVTGTPGAGWEYGDWGGGKHYRRKDPDGTYSYKALGGDLPLWGNQLVEVGELGYEFISIRNGKATVIPHSASRWLKEAGIVPGQGFALEQGGGHINTGGTNLAGIPWDQASNLLQKYSSQGGYQSSSGQIVVPGMTNYEAPLGSSPSEAGNPWGGGGGSSAAAAAASAAAAAAGAVGAQIPGAVAQANAANTAQLAAGNTMIAGKLDELLQATKNLKDELFLTMRDAVQQAR